MSVAKSDYEKDKAKRHAAVEDFISEIPDGPAKDAVCETYDDLRAAALICNAVYYNPIRIAHVARDIATRREHKARPRG